MKLGTRETRGVKPPADKKMPTISSGFGCSDEFCIEIRRDSNPRGLILALEKPSVLTTRPLAYIRLVPHGFP